MGNYTVKVMVSDGKESSNATASITVTSAGGIPPPATFTGTATGGCEPTGLIGACSSEPIAQKFPVPAGVTQMVIFLAWDATSGAATDLDLYVKDSTGKDRGSSACGNNPSADFLASCTRGTDEEVIVKSGAPVGEWTAEIVPYMAAENEYTLTVTYS